MVWCSGAGIVPLDGHIMGEGSPLLEPCGQADGVQRHSNTAHGNAMIAGLAGAAAPTRGCLLLTNPSVRFCSGAIENPSPVSHLINSVSELLAASQG